MLLRELLTNQWEINILSDSTVEEEILVMNLDCNGKHLAIWSSSEL